MEHAPAPFDPQIATERLLLRLPEEADLDAIVAEVNDYGVARMLARVPFPYTRSDAEDFLAWSRRGGDDLNLVVTRHGKVIGCIGLTDMQVTCEFGYWLGRAHWRQGLASEACRAFLSFCFEELAVATIRAGAFADNPASLRLQEKLGFLRTGVNRRQSFARAYPVEHVNTILTRDRFMEGPHEVP